MNNTVTGEFLSLSNRFMFAKVMQSNILITQRIIEAVIGKKISKINSITPERVFEDHTNSKNIRLDVCVETIDGNLYDVELQIQTDPDIAERSRYYHAILTHETLRMGQRYHQLKESVVIFICMYDPLGKNDFIYDFEMYNIKHKVPLKCHMYTYLVNATFSGNIPNSDLYALISALNGTYINSSFGNDLKNAVVTANADADWRNNIMTLEEFLEDEAECARRRGREEGRIEGRKEGRAEGRAEGRENGRADIARRMLKEGLDIELISRLTDFSIEEIITFKQ